MENDKEKLENLNNTEESTSSNQEIGAEDLAKNEEVKEKEEKEEIQKQSKLDETILKMTVRNKSW